MKSNLKIIVLILLFTLVSVGFFVKNNLNKKVLGEADVNNSRVYGLIIPHHDLAEELIIEAIGNINSDADYKNIVVIGPNHYYPDSYFITTAETLADYKVNKDFVRDLDLDFDQVDLDNEILQKEHSVLIPSKYLSEIYPEVSIIPLIISTHGDENTIQEVSTLLGNNFKDDTLFVLAIDFAHNLGFDEAMINNEESRKAISAFDYETILSYDDRFMDSSLSTVLFLKIMENIGAKNFKPINSSHGSVILGVPDLQGTSYVTGMFTR